MENWKIEPQNSCVAQFVQCYWLIEKEANDTTHSYPKLNPDPSATLLIAPKKQSYHYQNSNDEFSGMGSHWLFPNSRTLQLDHSQPFILIGIKFHIGALYSLDLIPKQPVIDLVFSVDINRLLNVDKLDLLARFQQENYQEQKCRDLLDNILSPWLSKFTRDSHSVLCQKAVDILPSNAVSDIGQLLHCSQRTIERSFVRVTGFTLKQCQSMNRFEAILERLYSLKETDINWLDIVEEFGFSDQAHMIRYLKSFIGDTPKEYNNKRDLTIDTYGDFKAL